MGTKQLAAIEHIVVLMLENRSFNHMLGFLYEASGNVSPTGDHFEGLTGEESNADADGAEVTVFKIDPGKPSAYFMPGCNPGEGYAATNLQLFGFDPAPAPPAATNSGFVTNFAATLAVARKRHRPIQPGTVPADMMGIFTPEMLPVLSGLASGYAVCDHWWGSAGNSQHPIGDVAKGEQLIHDVYRALRDGPGWNQTLLIITYDEHGGCYDHVPPPSGAFPPDQAAGEYGFDFTRFGVRVPAVMVSPLIVPGTVFRVPPGFTPLDHTSILKTVETRWGLPSLTARDAAAPDVGDALTLAAPRDDDPLDGVVVPTSGGANAAAGVPSHLEQVHAELVSELPLSPDERTATPPLADLKTPADYDGYIRTRTARWKASRP